jgi:hypothetical protein
LKNSFAKVGAFSTE